MPSSLGAEGCRVLDSRAALKQGEQHCRRCDGFGATPIMFDPNYTQFNPTPCSYCNHTGKEQKQ